jgi:flagellar basal body-associated protein FliL
MPAERLDPPKPAAPEETSAASAASRWSDSVGRLLSPKWIAILVVVSIAIHGVGFAYHKLRAGAAPEKRPAELGLGQFQFRSARIEREPGGLIDATFSLHVTLLDQLDEVGRQRLSARKHRVEQDVEQLLRRAHSADFEDPNLAELKRQIQEQINESVGMRAIADVIITNLTLRYGDHLPRPVEETVRGTPWVDPPSG